MLLVTCVVAGFIFVPFFQIIMKETTHITHEPLSYFLTHPTEKLLVAKRTHPLILVPKIATSIFVAFIMASALSFTLIYFSIPIVVTTLLYAALFGVLLSAIAKFFVDWYFHLYIVTNKKIVEVCYSPFFSDSVYDVRLERVRCTEIDIRTNGILSELFNIGDVAITFDRPTHQEEFVLKNIKNPRETGAFLGDVLDTDERIEEHLRWVRSRDGVRPFKFIEDIIPQIRRQQI